jgi:tetratricopeptide (TPR) repeat protein
MRERKVTIMSQDESGTLTETSVNTELEEVIALIEQVREMGANVDSAEAIVSQAKKALADGSIEISKSLLESAKKTTKLIKQQYFIQASSILFSSLQRTIVNLEGAGSEVNYIKDLYNKAKEMFDNGQYDEAMDYIKSAEDLANDLKLPLPPGTIIDKKSGEVAKTSETESELDQSQEQMERVSKTLIRVEKLLQEAIDAGYFVNDAEKLYSLAEDSFDYQDYKKAEEYALESQQSLEDILKPLHEEQQRKASGIDKAEVEETLDKKSKRDFRENMPTGDSFLTGSSKLTDMMPMGIIGDAPKSGEDAAPPAPASEEKVVDDELEVEKEATNLLITADEKITAAKEIGVNLPMAERLLTIGESYFDRGEFDKVNEYARKAIKQVDDMISHKGFDEQLKEALESDKTDLAATKEPKPMFEPEPEMETEPEPETKKGKKKARAGDKDIETKKTETANKLEAALHKIEVEIVETKNLGVNIEDTEELIQDALEELELGNLSEAKAIGISAKNKIKKIKKNFIKKKALELIKVAWKEIEIAEDNGMDVTEPNIELKNARNLIKDGKFEEAAKLAMTVIQLVKNE